MSERSDGDSNDKGAQVMPGFSHEDDSYEVSVWSNSVVRPFMKRGRERGRGIGGSLLGALSKIGSSTWCKCVWVRIGQNELYEGFVSE